MGRQRVRTKPAVGQQVNHIHAPRHGRVRQQLAMAMRRIGLGAHCRYGALAAESDNMIESLLKVAAGHMVGIALKGRLAPGAVGRIGPRRAFSAERFEMPVLDTGPGKRGVQRLAREMRMAGRFGDPPDVGYHVNLMRGEQREKCRQGMI